MSKSERALFDRNPVDRVVEFFAPRIAVRRYHARAVLSSVNGFAGASRSMRSMYGFDPGKTGPNKALKYDRQILINRSHKLTRDNPIVSGIVNSNCTNIVGPGLALQSRVDGDFLGLDEHQTEALETSIEREFALFADTQECDLSRMLNFSSMQELALRMIFVSGESVTVLPYLERGTMMPYGLKIQMVESERLCNENFSQDKKLDNGGSLSEGIERDKYGAPVRYHICREFPDGSNRSGLRWDKIDAFGDATGLRNVLHIFKMLRPGQYRGIPYLAPVIEPLYNLGRYTKAEIDAAVVASLFTVFIKTESGNSGTDTDNMGGETGAKRTDKDFKLGSGAILDLAPGEDVAIPQHGRPNVNFDPFFQAILRQIGMALEIPYEVLIKHYQSSYSAAQGALLDAWRFYKTRRKWFADSFCQPIFMSFMYEAVARGRIIAPGFFTDPLIRQAYCGAEWAGPARGHMNPSQEADAVKTRTDMGLTTMEQESIEYNGGRFDRNIRQIKRENELKRDAGIMGADSEGVDELVRKIKKGIDQ